MKRALLILVLVLSAHPLSSQPGEFGWTFLSFQQRITSLNFDAKPDSPEDQLLTRMSADLAHIGHSYRRQFGETADTHAQIVKNLGIPYSSSMADDFSALGDLPQGAKRLVTLGQVGADLSAKNAAVEGLRAEEASVLATVDVVVRIQPQAGQSLPVNLQVMANGWLHETRQPATYIFTSSGGNYEAKLPPGRFCLWVAGPGNILFEQPRDVGRTGDHEEFSMSLAGGIGTCAL